MERELNKNKSTIERLEKINIEKDEYKKELNENKKLIDKLKYEKTKNEREINQNKNTIEKLEKRAPEYEEELYQMTIIIKLNLNII